VAQARLGFYWPVDLVTDLVIDLDTDLVPDSDIGSVPDSGVDLGPDLGPDLGIDSVTDLVDLLHGFFFDSPPPGRVNFYFKWPKPAWASIGR